MGTDKGITKACPECRRIIFSAGEFEGTGKLKIKCPNCGIKVLIVLGQSTRVSLQAVVIPILILVIVSGLLFGGSLYAKRKRAISCQNFKTWEEAQDAFESDRAKYKALDSNNNGEACEHLKNL